MDLCKCRFLSGLCGTFCQRTSLSLPRDLSVLPCQPHRVLTSTPLHLRHWTSRRPASKPLAKLPLNLSPRADRCQRPSLLPLHATISPKNSSIKALIASLTGQIHTRGASVASQHLYCCSTKAQIRQQARGSLAKEPAVSSKSGSRRARNGVIGAVVPAYLTRSTDRPKARGPLAKKQSWPFDRGAQEHRGVFSSLDFPSNKACIAAL